MRANTDFDRQADQTMTLNLHLPDDQDELKPRITVFGVGGAGGNAVNNMIDKALDGVEFVVANTDAQALQQNRAPARVQMGIKATEGLGAGARPSVGALAAEEAIDEILDHLAGSHMCFITAGMGGGTGTGAAPIIAQAARELGVLTVGVVTKPFQFEGGKRMRQAEEGVEALQKVVDTLIIIPNQNLFRLANEKTTFTEAFALADDVLYQGVKGVTDLMVRPGLINLDFADVRAVMDEMGKAMMGTGEAEGEERAITAAEKAIANPLLDEISLRGAKGVLINITGSHDLTLFELDEAANVIREQVDPDANIIVGSTLDTSMEGKMRVSVVATGIDASEESKQIPVPRRSLKEPLDVQKPAEAPAPVAAQEAAPQRTVIEPMPIAAEQASPEPTLFDSTEMEAEEPPRAYTHAPEPDMLIAAEPPQATYDPAPTPADAPGAPSPAELARLRAAIGRSAPAPEAPEAHPAPVAQRAKPVAAPEPAPATGRFGIGSLIGRMSGNSEASHQPPAGRAQPSVGRPRHDVYEESAEHDPEQERIEVPAFLRRQAN